MGCGQSRGDDAQPDPGAVAFAGAPPADAPAALVQEPTAEQQVEIVMVETAAGASAPAPAGSSDEPTVSQQANADKEEAAAAPPDAPMGYQPTEGQLAAAQKVNAEQDARAAAAEALPEETKRKRYKVDLRGR